MRFVDCSACGQAYFAQEAACPHCAARRVVRAHLGPVWVAAVALGGCFPIAEPAYGIAESGEWEESSGAPSSTAEPPSTSHGTMPTPDPTDMTLGDTSSDDGSSTSVATSEAEGSTDGSTSEGDTSEGGTSEGGTSEGGTSGGGTSESGTDESTSNP